MKNYFLVAVLFHITLAMAQPLPHSMVYGQKPNTLGLLPAAKLESYMGKRTRISITISGRVNRVTNTKGGWFVLDSGRGGEIEAHFTKADITIPENLKGRNVIAEGIAQKQFIADDMQHFAGEKPERAGKAIAKAKPKITFEVKGLMIN